MRERVAQDVILVAKKGDDVEFPDYLVSALSAVRSRRLQSQQSASPKLEAGCTINCSRLSIF